MHMDQIREIDRMGNDRADAAADFGRRRVDPAVVDARRNLSGVCRLWYPRVLEFHGFFVAISRTVVNNAGSVCVTPDPLVWSAGFQNNVGLHTPFVIMLCSLVRTTSGVRLGWNTSYCNSCYSIRRLLVTLVTFLGGQLLLEVWVLAEFLDGILFLYQLWTGGGSSKTKLSPGIVGQGVQVQCRLFHMVQALIFGVRAGSCLVVLEPITVVFGMFGGKRVGTGSRPVQAMGRLRLFISSQRVVALVSVSFEVCCCSA